MWQRLHSPGPPELHRRIALDAPAGRRHLDHVSRILHHVQVDGAVVPGHGRIFWKEPGGRAASESTLHDAGPWCQPRLLAPGSHPALTFPIAGHLQPRERAATPVGVAPDLWRPNP